MPRKMTQDEFIKLAKSIHKNKFNYEKTIYKNSSTKISIYCNKHKVYFCSTPNNHIHKKSMCKKCGYESSSKKSRIGLKNFIHKSEKAHGKKYDYSLIKDLKLIKDKVKIICPTHGVFEQMACNHIKGHGCILCSAHQRSKNTTVSEETFFNKAIRKHKNKYDYSMSNYQNYAVPIKIKCLKHNFIFEQQPRRHLKCINCCPICRYEIVSKKLSNSLEEFINNSKNIHNQKYNYDLVEYVNSHKKVKIICPCHGVFEQSPHSHLKGDGCKKCSNIISSKENIWLKSHDIPNDKDHRYVFIKIGKKRIFADGFDKQTNTIYEFYGDYFHGNPKVYNPDRYNRVCHKTMKELYDKQWNENS